MKTTSTLLLFTFFLSLAYIGLTSSSGGRATVANSANTGAPGETTTCSGCHGGSFGTVTLTLNITKNGLPVTSYQPDTTYDMNLTITNTSGNPVGWGFQMTALRTPSNTALGGWSNFPTNVNQDVLPNGRTYIEHIAKLTSSSNSFKWKAPAAGSGNVTFYYAGIAANSFGSSGDGVGSGNKVLTEQAAALSISNSTVTNVSCFNGNNGAISLTTAGGTSPLTFAWSDAGSGANRSNLAAGTYSVTITDNASQTVSQSFTVTQPAAALNSTGTVTAVACSGNNNGAITLNTVGGTPNYTYNWGGGVTSQNRTNLTAGTYTVTTTDSKACTATASFIVTQPNPLTATPSVTNATCANLANGSVTFTYNGGNAPYTLSGLSQQTNLAAGTYAYTVTDAKNCTFNSSFNVLNNSQVTLSGIVVQASCNGTANGGVNLTATGGASPYGFNWSNSTTNQNLSGVAAGNYAVTATDNVGCSASATYTVSEASSLATNPTITDTKCSYSIDGSAVLNTSGGQTPYSFNWSNGNTTGQLTNVASGTYQVTITDANSCNKLQTIVINAPDTLKANLTSTNPTCFGSANGSINSVVTGGSGTLIFAWSNNTSTQNLANVGAGAYSITVTDVNACTATSNVTLTQPNAIQVTESITNATADDIADGAINLTVSGGIPTYTYSWSNGAQTEDLNNVGADTYTVTIADANGCTAIESFTISAPSGIEETAAFGIVKIYPNPFTQQFAVELDNKDAIISVFNASGSLLLTTKERIINISEAANGLYFLQLKNEETGAVKTFRLVKN